MSASDWLSVAILGVVEGITEFLPVSSTGHLLIAERWLPRQSDLFNIVIQCGAVLAVKVAVAFVITGAGGLAMEKAGLKLPETLLPVAIALFVGGVLFVVVERVIAGKPAKDEITWAVAVAVGAGQLVAAAFPGASRSGTTILIMLVMGVSRVAATEFTFLVGIPTILAAGAFKIFKAVHHGGAQDENWAAVAVGFVVAAVVSFVVVRWLLRYVQRNTFTAFGLYRIAVAGVIFGLLMTS
jgi:undecaprenyl-diphosphatase